MVLTSCRPTESASSGPPKVLGASLGYEIGSAATELALRMSVPFECLDLVHSLEQEFVISVRKKRDEEMNVTRPQ